jgi:hypothetical protein
MSLFSKLFGGGPRSAPKETVEDHNGFRIIATPISEGGDFILSARIEVDKDGETLTHTLIRADRIRSREEAEQAAIAKARQVIDQSGMGLFR